jgi:hypothetical protein
MSGNLPGASRIKQSQETQRERENTEEKTEDIEIGKTSLATAPQACLRETFALRLLLREIPGVSAHFADFPAGALRTHSVGAQSVPPKYQSTIAANWHTPRKFIY